ncbi:MAG: transposase [Alphaproteobacteria bacterium]|nr:transposase [Alphaproteobacteria bacterium]
MSGTGRELAAWIGLVSKQNSAGGKARMGRISKQRDSCHRLLLVAGAMAVVRHGRRTGFKDNPWLADLTTHKPAKVAAVALANKNARTAWALAVSGETCRRRAGRA